VICW